MRRRQVGGMTTTHDAVLERGPSRAGAGDFGQPTRTRGA